MIDTNAGSNASIGEVINSGRYTESLRQAALDLSHFIVPLFGEPGRLRLLQTSANIAPLFVRSELQTLNQLVPLTAERQKQAEVAITQAATLSGYIAVLFGEDPFSPLTEDCLTIDMNDLTLLEVASDLAQQGLGGGQFGATTNQHPIFPVQGMLWWIRQRPFFEMIVECRGRRVKLPIFVHNGAQAACLNKISWQALAPNVDTSSWKERKCLFGKIHGIDAQIHFGQGSTAGVNMVGNQWLSRAGLIMIADYARLGCALIKSDKESRKALPSLPRIYQ